MSVRLSIFFLAVTAVWITQLGLCVPSVHAQPPAGASEQNEDSNWRYDYLQLLLEERKMRVERSLLSMFDNARKSLIVVGNDGENAIRSLESRTIIDFVERGGAVLLMHELNGKGRGDRLVLSGLGIFHKGPVSAISDQDVYEGYSDCVRVTNIRDRQGLFANIKMLVANRAGWFKPSESSDWDWETVATFPTASMPIEAQPKPLLCIGRPKNSEGGIAIVLSDSSLLANSMLWHGDNGRLALRLSELFHGQGRDRFYMLRNNISLDSVTQRLAEKMREEAARAQPPNLPRPKPTYAQMLDLGNIVAKEVIDSNVLNEALQRQPRHMPPERYFRFLVILLIAGAMIWILWKLLTSRSLREFWLARRRQRFAYEIQSGNEAGDYRTAASYLAQEFCIQWTGSHHSRQWQQSLATLLVRWPSVTPSDRHELSRIVDIASRGCHERMLGPDFQKFGKSIDMLRRLLFTSTPA